MMLDPVSTSISLAALFISGVTAWLTYGRRGTVRMSRPAQIYFGPDGTRSNRRANIPKVYLRTLLFSTAKRGRIIESMYAALHHNEARQNFHIWVYGDDKLSRGSGLFIGETGMTSNHHFLTSESDRPFSFTAGDYDLEVYAHLLGDGRPVKLLSQRLHVTESNAKALADSRNGLYFDWGPDAGRYLPHIDKGEPPPDAADMLRMLRSPPSVEAEP
jgi:hypothetical protein